jgi:hypothetical protein
MATITEIFSAFGDEYQHRFPDMPEQHRRVMQAIVHCHSGEYGVAVYQCDDCRQRRVVGCACGNRHCPQCQYHKSRQWLETQLTKGLPGNHCMLTFTVPAQLRPFCRAHQRAAYAGMFKASSGAIVKLVRDPRFIGAEHSGFTGVLHTWGRQLQYHPHIHYIVPAGGVSADKTRWMPSHNAFYLPVRALSKIFRAKFRDEMEKTGLLAEINPAVWTIDWNVNCQAVGSAEASLKYLAPYVFRVAISNSRIIGVHGRTITFSFRQSGSNRPRKLGLDALEFIRRFLQHVLPSGFMKVRHYGFMSGQCAIGVARLRVLIHASLGSTMALSELLTARPPKPPPPQPICGACGGTLLHLFSLFPRRPGREPT